tara:strand:- start:1354 stop:2904 length:1551 start_codon:yes stop_codon:yes gene_type:complete
LPSPAEVALAAGERAFFIVVDFSDFFFQIPLHEDSQRLTVADIGGVNMACKGLPQGLRLSPWVAQRLANTLVAALKERGMNAAMYLDDLICWGGSAEELIYKRDKILIPLVKQLGLVIAPGKGIWDPSQRVEYLGIIIDSIRKVFALSEVRRLGILSLTQSLIDKGKASARELASLAGKIISTKLTLHHAQISAAQVWRLLRTPQRQKSWDHSTHLRRQELDVLGSILTIFGHHNIERDWTPEHAVRIFVDASPTGYGGVAPNLNVPDIIGLWADGEKKLSTTVREMRAVRRVLDTAKEEWPDLCGKIWHLQIDAKAAISYLKRGTGVFQHLRWEVDQVYAAAHRASITLWEPAWVPSERQLADAPSRWKDDHGWELQDSVYDKLCSEMDVIPQVDLFATGQNNKCARYFTRFYQVGSAGVDAMRYSWADCPFYGCPPVPLVQSVALKIAAEGVHLQGVLVVPSAPGPALQILRRCAVKSIELGWASDLVKDSATVQSPRGKLTAFFFSRSRGRIS